MTDAQTNDAKSMQPEAQAQLRQHAGGQTLGVGIDLQQAVGLRLEDRRRQAPEGRDPGTAERAFQRPGAEFGALTVLDWRDRLRVAAHEPSQYKQRGRGYTNLPR